MPPRGTSFLSPCFSYREVRSRGLPVAWLRLTGASPGSRRDEASEGTAGHPASQALPSWELVGPAHPRDLPESSWPTEEVEQNSEMMILTFCLRRLGLEKPHNLSRSHADELSLESGLKTRCV